VSRAQFGTETNQLVFDFNFAKRENPLNNASDPARAGRDERSIEYAAGARPKVDTGGVEFQDLVFFWVSLKSSACAWCISASDN
jgi:hypothetical protein